MEGDVQNDSSTGSESGGETGGQDIYDEVLENLEGLTQKVGDLENRVKTSESSLSEMKSAYSSLINEGGINNIKMTDIKRFEVRYGEAVILTPESGAVALIISNPQRMITVTPEGNGFIYSQHVQNGSSGLILLPEGCSKIKIWYETQTDSIATSYCFLVKQQQ